MAGRRSAHAYSLSLPGLLSLGLERGELQVVRCVDTGGVLGSD